MQIPEAAEGIAAALAEVSLASRCRAVGAGARCVTNLRLIESLSKTFISTPYRLSGPLANHSAHRPHQNR